MYVTQCVHRSVQQSPDRLVTVFGDRARTAAESADRIARLAGALRSLGVRSGDRVAMLALNSDRYHEYLLAVPWADAVVEPLNTRWSVPEIAYALRDSETRVLLVDESFAPLVPELRTAYDGLSTVIYCGDGEAPEGLPDYEQILAAADPVEDARRGGDNLYGLFYTGGTTGRSKGVMLSHDNLLNSTLGVQATGDWVTPRGRLLHTAPMFHLADLAAWASGTLVGTVHVIVPAFDPAPVLATVAEHKVTDLLLVPTMIQKLTDAPERAGYDLSGVRRVMYGASPISEALLQRARKAFPAADFTQVYGMTELSPVITVLGSEDHGDSVRRRSAGRAAPHSEIRIVDPEDREVPRGGVGEVVVRGDHIMLGYWGQPEETAAAVRDGWMHTGDGAYLDDHGYVFIVDRIKDMIVSGGENVYSTEVENALAKHPAVATCAVFGIPDETWGERVHAVAVLVPGEQATAEELRDFCREHIAGYKVPRSVDFADALPVSGAGKILKRELRAQYWAEAERQVR